MSQVIETMRMLPVQSIAGAPAPVLGLCIIRGAPTPVIETAALFGERRTSNAVLVTVRAGTRTVALAADAILGVQALAARELGQLPPLLSDVQAIAALTSLDEQLVFVLNAARVVPDDVLERCLSEGAAA